jgi:2-methylcitrate dehydratase
MIINAKPIQAVAAHSADINQQTGFDTLFIRIADYVCNTDVYSALAYDTAFYALKDAVACAMQALGFPECTKHLGAVVPGTVVPGGARVLGTSHVLDPIKAAYDNGVLIRWLDYNDTWLAHEWGHPSDNLGGILAVADFVSQKCRRLQKKTLTLRDVLTAQIKAYEIQGRLAIDNSFNAVGLDHVILVKLASTAVITRLLGGTREEVIHAISQVFVDGQSLRVYRHAPNTGARKSWAAGDATSRAVQLALLTLKGERGYQTALTVPRWGFSAVCFKEASVVIPEHWSDYVMENILFKIAFPAEFHAQTAVEAAIALHPQVVHRLSEITKIVIETQEPAIRIISKTGPLHNPADRDHCLQYMTAVGLIYGYLEAVHYEQATAQNPEIDRLRSCMQVVENPAFTHDYYDPQKRSIGNTVRVFFKTGEATDPVTVEYPIGHRQRREKAWGLLDQKFEKSLRQVFCQRRVQDILAQHADRQQCEQLAVDEWFDLFVQ